MTIKEVDLKEVQNDLFRIDNTAFNRDFDIKAKSVKEELDYLQNSKIYVAFEETKAIGFIAYEDRKDLVENASAIILYLKLGFEIYGLKENYYGDGQPRLLLKRYMD